MLIKKATFMPDVSIPTPKMKCPTHEPNITRSDFPYYLQAAMSGCDFKARMMFHPSQQELETAASNLGLTDSKGEPVVLERSECEAPFKALVLCNGTIFPGDKVRIYSQQALILSKQGR